MKNVMVCLLIFWFSLNCLSQTNNIVSSQMVSNIVALKQANVSDAVIIAYLQMQPKQFPVLVSPSPTVSIDQDSYEYFYRFYLHPRTLRYRYRMLYPYQRPVNIYIR